MKPYLPWLILLSCFAFHNSNAAETFPVTARLFGGNQSIKPTEVNAAMTAQGLENINTLLRVGVEATYPMAKFVDIGLRYTRRWGQKADTDPATDYYGELTQDSVGGIVRIPFLKTKFLRADVFGEYAGTNTKFEIKSATVNGQYLKRGPEAWFGDSQTTYGASVGAGYNMFFLTFEVGVENNVANRPTVSGTTTTTINSMDLSTTYVSAALVFDGVKAEKR